MRGSFVTSWKTVLDVGPSSRKALGNFFSCSLAATEKDVLQLINWIGVLWKFFHHDSGRVDFIFKKYFFFFEALHLQIWRTSKLAFMIRDIHINIYIRKLYSCNLEVIPEKFRMESPTVKAQSCSTRKTFRYCKSSK